MKSLIAVLLTVLLLAMYGSAEAAERVTQVTAVATAHSNLPPLVAERMNRSVAAIAGQLLEGKEITEVCAQQENYENLIHEVFDKVLVGYTVSRVHLETGETTVVQVELLPWSETIQTVQVEILVEGMPPRIEKMVRADLTGVEHVFEDALTGLPVAAADWTNGVLKQHLNAYLAVHLPEFRGDFDLVPEPGAKIRLTVYPRLPVVRTVDLSMRSDTMLNSALVTHRELMQDQVNDIVGVPVGFVERHKEELAAQFAQGLDSRHDFRLLKMHTRVEIDPAERSRVMSRSDTTRYKIRLNGWLDLGRSKGRRDDTDSNMLFRLHAGQMLSPRDEAFAQLDFCPADMEWDYRLGYRRILRGGRFLGLRYDLRRDRVIYDAMQKLGSRWFLRYEYRMADHMGEGALRYRLHDFLSLEYVLDNEQNWLRLIGNF